MPRYAVTLRMTSTREISVWARDEDAAKDKAEEIVGQWDGVIDAQAEEAQEVET